MRHFALLIVLFLALIAQAQSQTSVKQEKIKALFALMHQDSLMIKTIDGMNSSMVQRMTAMFRDTSFTKSGIDVSQMIQRLMEKNMQKSKENALKLLNGEMVDIYDKYFTIEEIDDFSAFYKSKSGQKMLSQMPDITKDIMAVMATKYQADFQQSLMKDIQEITSQMKAKE